VHIRHRQYGGTDQDEWLFAHDCAPLSPSRLRRRTQTAQSPRKAYPVTMIAPRG
jgi:hypothetical protein